MDAGFIRIRGARAHNLKGVSLDIPRDKFTVITGVSGSGKSSLAFDTIYAEGQRRYVESLSAYARQYLEQLGKPDVESIEGLSPAISIDQRSVSRNPRSTVGTATEIYDYMRLLFARVGKPHCWSCGKPIASQSVQQIVDAVMKAPEGSKVLLLAPVARGKKGEFKDVLDDLLKRGFIRVRIDGKDASLPAEVSLSKTRRHDIDVVVDRLVVKPGIEARCADSVETALGLASGLVRVETVGGRSTLFSQKNACPDCGVSYPEIEPRLFSFNSPFGACPRCKGLGEDSFFDEGLVVADPGRPILEGAIAAYGMEPGQMMSQAVETVYKKYGADIATPVRELPAGLRKVVFYGSGDEKFLFVYRKENRRYQVETSFEGLIPTLERRYRETSSERMREEYAKFRSSRPCPDCAGARLRREALSVKVGGGSIHEVSSLPVDECGRFLRRVELSGKDAVVGGRILKELLDRLGFLESVGVPYLALSRPTATLAGGEAQRIRLATQIGSALVGVIYVLDEPSIGLHPRDNERLVETLLRLRDLGNTVIVVEHDEETILRADHVVDLGPGAGVHGGEVVAEGPPVAVKESEASLTGRYLSGRKRIELPGRRRKPRGWLKIEKANVNNLKDIDASFPLGVFCCVTGVSGSGKSSLVLDALQHEIERALADPGHRMSRCEAVRGIEHLDKVIAVDQSPIGRTPRSNPATYTGLFTPIRDIFAGLPESRVRGYKAGRFSFNVAGGRCEACEGGGTIRIEMHFLPDVFVECEACRGLRYNRETLQVRYRDKNIAEVLDMPVEEATAFFRNIPAVRERLQTLLEVGLGYVRLGQAATTLSGGEAQRIKLSRELARRSTGRTLYVMDEPTTGLHFEDIGRLLCVIQRLVDQGNTVVVIEHNRDIVKCADYVIDLGPEGGARGGEIVATGTPEQIAACPASMTGRFLERHLRAGAP